MRLSHQLQTVNLNHGFVRDRQKTI